MHKHDQTPEWNTLLAITKKLVVLLGSKWSWWETDTNQSFAFAISQKNSPGYYLFYEPSQADSVLVFQTRDRRIKKSLRVTTSGDTAKALHQYMLQTGLAGTTKIQAAEMDSPMDTFLYERLQKVAQEQPSLRAHLVPLLRNHASLSQVACTCGGDEDDSMEVEASGDELVGGRTWGAPDPHSTPDDKTPYHKHKDSPPAGADGSPERKRYNNWFRKNVCPKHKTNCGAPWLKGDKSAGTEKTSRAPRLVWTDKDGPHGLVATAKEPEGDRVYHVTQYADSKFRWTLRNPNSPNGVGGNRDFRTFDAAIKDAEQHAFALGVYRGRQAAKGRESYTLWVLGEGEDEGEGEMISGHFAPLSSAISAAKRVARKTGKYVSIQVAYSGDHIGNVGPDGKTDIAKTASSTVNYVESERKLRAAFLRATGEKMVELMGPSWSLVGSKPLSPLLVRDGIIPGRFELELDTYLNPVLLVKPQAFRGFMANAEVDVWTSESSSVTAALAVKDLKKKNPGLKF